MLAPVEILEKWVGAGKAKASNPASKVFVLAVLAGVYIAFAGIASATAAVSINASHPSLAKLLGASIFPGGLAMVLLAGSELFTGNTLILIPVLHKEVKVSSMLRNWIIVYIGNFAGSVLIALAVNYGHTLGMFDGQLAQAVASAAKSKVSLTFGDAFIRGILCNILVCAAVWIASGTNSAGGKIAGLFFPIMMFVLCGFEHSVANMYYLTAGWLAERVYDLPRYVTWDAILLKNLLPVTLGNIVGSCVFIAGFYTFVYKPKKIVHPSKKSK